MSYAQYGLVQATDFNTLAGGDPTTTSGTLNAVWATGGTNAGYGQTALANVSVGNTVTAITQWANLVTNTANAASHQGTSITAVSAPTSGGTITYLSAIPTNLTTIYNSRLNAATQGSTSANTELQLVHGQVLLHGHTLLLLQTATPHVISLTQVDN